MEGYKLGFTAPERELENYEVDVEGELPDWVSGSLYRNGPGMFEVGDEEIDHWFDGLAMLNQYDVDGENDSVSYSNRFLRSDVYDHRMDGDENILETAFNKVYGRVSDDNEVPSTIEDAFETLDSVGFMVRNGPPDNANVHVAQIEDDYVALTEAPGWRAFNPENLETGERYTFDDDISTHLSTGHLHHDMDKGEHIGYSTGFGLTHEYNLYRIPEGESERELITSIETDEPSYMHSIGLSENYAILTEIPFTINPRNLVLGADGFLDQFNWEPENGTTFTVIDRDSGEVAMQKTVDPFFTFHHANCYEDENGDALYVDLVSFEGPSIFEDISLDAMKNGGHVDGGDLTRYELPHPDSNETTDNVSSYTLAENIAFPRINPDAHTNEHRYVYSRSLDHTDGIGLARIDTATEDTDIWYDPGVYAEEPVFVPNPHSDEEDDGLVLAQALDATEDTSMLLALDGETFEETARAYLPQHVPFGFHGDFFPDQ